jgi:hypothetical protein
VLKSARAVTVVIAVSVAGCAPRAEHAASTTCPVGSSVDPARHAALVAALAGDTDAYDAASRLGPPCFGPTRTLGTLVGARPVLEGAAPDVALAARLAHLGVHVRDRIGDGCARGLEAARASERRARDVETRVRSRAGLSPLARDDAADADYVARCGPRR